MDAGEVGQFGDLAGNAVTCADPPGIGMIAPELTATSRSAKVTPEALRDLAAGLTHNEIADLRGVSPATIKKRLERAREVPGARNAVHAVAIATRRGLILRDPTF